jgi:hypothetical protein
VLVTSRGSFLILGQSDVTTYFRTLGMLTQAGPTRRNNHRNKFRPAQFSRGDPLAVIRRRLAPPVLIPHLGHLGERFFSGAEVLGGLIASSPFIKSASG